ncbi:hypothetical protein PV379_03400 [Streptomyces caniscabiei]|uniref:hypothetical protein n=1 Tax=Streptomyces caniscabiei TaxID=2746961 RepID=UPI0029A1589C|nr:hypothetical protein [Streptomyces caniscabiei]MDX2776385.1 hypothetical protein [Streptomyces caniscabiei]
MSIESGPRQYHDHDDDERRGYDAASMPDQAPTYNEPPRPDYVPTPSGFFDSEDAGKNGGWLRSGRVRLLAGVAAGSVLIGGGIVLGLSGEREEKEPRLREPGTSAPAVPGEQSPSAQETDSGVTQFETNAEYAPTIYDTALYKELTLEQQHEVKKLDEMSYITFRQLPYDRQLAYGDFYYRAYKDYGMEQVKRSPYYQKDTPEIVDAGSSGQAILNDFAARQSTLFYSIAENGSPYNINEANRVEAQKALSYIYAPGDSNIYKSRVEQLANLQNLEADQENHYNGDGYPVRKADRESVAGEVFGETVKYINVQDKSGEYDQYVYTFRTYTDIQGEERSVWQLSKILGEGHSQYQPDVESLFQ